MKNQPYKKVHIQGHLVNPVTVEVPFTNNSGMNRRARKRFIKQLIKKAKANGKRN